MPKAMAMRMVTVMDMEGITRDTMKMMENARFLTGFLNDLKKGRSDLIPKYDVKASF